MNEKPLEEVENTSSRTGCRNNCLCQLVRCVLDDCDLCATGPTGPTGATGPRGATGPNGATERLFKSSNKIIIDSS